jgi:hypothetical protein
VSAATGAGPDPGAPGLFQAQLEQPLQLEGPRETRVLVVGPVAPPEKGGLVLLGAVLTVQPFAERTRVHLRWRVVDPKTDEEREARTQVARFEGNGGLRILAALDRDDVPAGPGRVYELTAQLEGAVLLAHVATASARAGPLAPAVEGVRSILGQAAAAAVLAGQAERA